jgi:hypothetical protein
MWKPTLTREDRAAITGLMLKWEEIGNSFRNNDMDVRFYLVNYITIRAVIKDICAKRGIKHCDVIYDKVIIK